jgi:hypothetical protein
MWVKSAILARLDCLILKAEALRPEKRKVSHSGMIYLTSYRTYFALSSGGFNSFSFYLDRHEGDLL